MATNLLLLDESLLVQRVVELAFRDTGVDVHMAEDADAALEMAENAPPDIVVASLDMQNSDALDFCRRLREKPGLSQVPLLILTSTRNNVSDEEIEELEATGNIEKPFKPIVFTTEVERILGPGAGVPTPDRKEQAEPDSPEKAMEEETPLPSVDIIGESEETPPAPVAEEALEETEEAPAETESAHLRARWKNSHPLPPLGWTVKNSSPSSRNIWKKPRKRSPPHCCAASNPSWWRNSLIS